MLGIYIEYCFAICQDWAIGTRMLQSRGYGWSNGTTGEQTRRREKIYKSAIASQRLEAIGSGIPRSPRLTHELYQLEILMHA